MAEVPLGLVLGGGEKQISHSKFLGLRYWPVPAISEVKIYAFPIAVFQREADVHQP
jgi:hypothetical protein